MGDDKPQETAAAGDLQVAEGGAAADPQAAVDFNYAHIWVYTAHCTNVYVEKHAKVWTNKPGPNNESHWFYWKLGQKRWLPSPHGPQEEAEAAESARKKEREE